MMHCILKDFLCFIDDLLNDFLDLLNLMIAFFVQFLRRPLLGNSSAALCTPGVPFADESLAVCDKFC